MKKRFSEDQVVRILQEGDCGGKVSKICRKHGISEVAFYRWQQKYAGMGCGRAQAFKGS